MMVMICDSFSVYFFLLLLNKDLSILIPSTWNDFVEQQ